MTFNRKFLVTAMSAALGVPGAANAAVTIGSVDGTNLPYVASGSSVMGDYITVSTGVNGDLAAEATFTVTLPSGMSFNSAPTAVVTQTGGTLTLSDSVGDPAGTVSGTMVDTDGDGLNDRARWTVANASTANDMVTIKGLDVAYSGTGSQDDVLTANVTAGVIGAANIAKVATDSSAPAANHTAPSIQQTKTDTTSVAKLLVTVPSGAAVGSTITLTVPSTVTSIGGSGLTATGLTDGQSVTLTTATAANVITLTTATAATTAAAQFMVSITGFTTASAELGDLNATVAGTAGATGTVKVASVAASGTTNTATDFQSGGTAKSVSIGGANARTVSNIVLTELFGDVVDSGKTFTITAPTGITFTSAGSVASDTTGTANATVALDTSTNTITVTTASDAASSATSAGAITLQSVALKAASTYTGSTVPLTITDVDSNVTGGALVVANAAAPATTVAGPTTVPTIGLEASTATLGTATLTEDLYGAVKTASDITLTAPSGVTIESATLTGISGTLTTTDGDAAAGNQAFVNPGGASAFWTTTAESSASGENTLTLTVVATVDDTVAAGTDLDFTFSGAAGVSGSVTLATVDEGNTLTAGSTATLTPGSTTAQTASALTITESFASALSTGTIRIIAPTGVTFADATSTGSGIASANGTIGTTFVANDTVSYTLTATGAVDTATITPKVFVASDASGMLSFTVSDGDNTGASLTGMTGGTVTLGYAGTVDTLAGTSAGDTIPGGTTTIAITGGVAPYTVASSDDTLATATVTDSTVTVTGVAAGAPTITVTDSLGTTVDVAVTVQALASVPDAPAVEGRMPGGGTSTDSGVTYSTDGAASTSDTLAIPASITPESGDETATGSVFVVASVSGSSAIDGVYMKTSSGAWSPWTPADGFSALEAFATGTLSDITANIAIADRALPAGTYRIFVGYQDADGDIHYSGTAVEVITVTAPAS